MDQLLTPKSGIATIDPTLPFITNERFDVYLDNPLVIPTDKENPFAVTDKYRFIPSQFNTELRQFYTDHKNLRRMVSRESSLARTNVLPVFNYNTLFQALVTGRFAEYRKFDLVLRSVLSNVTSITGRHQFLHVPLSTNIYTRQHFFRAFNKLDPSTVRFKNDQSYFFLIHFLGMLVEGSTTSLFNLLTEAQLDSLYVIFSCGKEAIIYNLGDLKAMVNSSQFHQVVIRHINTLKLLGHADIDALNKMSDAEFDTLSDKVAIAEPDIDFEEVPLDPAQVRSVVKQTVPTVIPVVAPTQPVATPPVQQEISSTTAPVVAPVQATKLQPQVSPIEEISQAAKQSIQKDERLSDKQKEAVVSVTDVWKTLAINGIPLTTLVSDTEDPKPQSKQLDFLKGQIPDESMLTSSIVDYNQHYVEKMMLRDIVSVALSFAAQGMFLVSIDEQTVITQLDRLKIYKFTYADATGRKHTSTVKLPIVSPDGTFMTNGVEQRMSMQMVNRPICKISPMRVNLSSNFNKTLVERTVTKAHTYDNFISAYVYKVYRATGQIQIGHGSYEHDATPLPYDYSCLASKYVSLQFADYQFVFDYKNRFDSVAALEALITTDELRARGVQVMEREYGIYCGTRGNTRMFFGMDNVIRYVDPSKLQFIDGKPDFSQCVVGTDTFVDLLFRTFGDQVPPPKMISEWTELKILDKNFPIVYVLGFRFGLKAVLEELKVPYTILPKGQRYQDIKPSTIRVAFSDFNLYFDRYPLFGSLILSGLNKFDLSKYEMSAFDAPNVYYTLFEDNGIKLNYFKGISSFFDLFIDPITKWVLQSMGEPTTVKGLLYRATQMLVTSDAIPASSTKNLRYRGYERFPAIMYNEMARSMATYQSRRGGKDSFSINPESVFLRIISDATVNLVENLNPVNDMKSKTSITYTGSGGRTAQSFVVDDRVYPADGVGVISESTPDSNKVAITAYTPVDPLIADGRGMFFDAPADLNTMQPTQVLSVSALLMPGSTQDDWAIHMAHQSYQVVTFG